MVILVFGPQGSGKTTHAHYIAEKLGISYLSTGDILRTLMEEPTPLGKKVKDLMHQGYIIPDEITIDALKSYFEKNKIGDSFVLEGFPRTMDQVKNFPLKVDQVFEFTLPEDLAIERLKSRGRHDDSPEGIKRRLELFKEKTLPVMEHFKKSGVKVNVVSNEPGIEEVQKEIDELLKN